MILAFGDSLTNGFGVGYEFSYPKYLEQRVGKSVISAGVDGEYSHAGLSRLSEYLEAKPELVILCHGANDIFTQMSTERLKKNLVSMVRLIRESGAEVILVGLPDYYGFGFEVHPVYYEVAQEMDILLEDGVMQEITLTDSLKNDDVHPNEKGYEKMADTFFEFLTQKGLIAK
ncbi:MAG: GDSL-type esterase/lipase family protein [Campylobacterota bacterium]|nr:GDSL-type esterase/lipase family protein [Campylobacterota bacterium]